ncbi:MAG: hypothetical protein WC375_13035 [Methanomassiliicoccales archaeon]|jgi:hypothetical protein
MNWYKKSQQENNTPSIPNIMVDLNERPRGVPSFIKNQANKLIHKLGDFHSEIPLSEIFDILNQYNLIPLQEDGTPWSGMLIGGKKCGETGSEQQTVNLRLAFKMPDDTYHLITSVFHLSWCVMSDYPNKRYEIVAYVG